MSAPSCGGCSPPAWSVHVAHPTRVRHFARAAGHQAKTDALDAQMLARYGAVFDLPSGVAQDADSEALQDLLRRRKQLVDQRVQERHRLSTKGEYYRAVQFHPTAHPVAG